MNDFAKRGRRNRQRGQEGEREVATILTEALGIPVKRILGQERDSGVDIKVGPFAIDCKRRKKVANLYEWMADFSDDVTLDDMSKIPAIALRADGERWLVVMELDDFITIAREEIAKDEWKKNGKSL